MFNLARTDVQALDLDLLTYHWIRKHQRQHTPLVEFPAKQYSVSDSVEGLNELHVTMIVFLALEGYMLKELLDANMPRMRTFLAGMVSELDKSWQGHYSLWVRYMKSLVFVLLMFPGIWN